MKKSYSQTICCVACKHVFPIILCTDGESKCAQCGFSYYVNKGNLGYDFRALLFTAFRDKYLLNAVLNNNSDLSYLHLKESSLSVSSRSDVVNFRDFMVKHGYGREILDIGCGPLPLPGYLQFDDRQDLNIVGIDPIENINFEGFKIIGTGEYIPLCNDMFDTVIFGTSLDHLVSMEATIDECKRVLKPGGQVFVWMGDRTPLRLSFKEIIYKALKPVFASLGLFPDDSKTWTGAKIIGDYYIYPNYSVFYVPKGAVDPFHSYKETPKEVIEIFRNKGFSLVDKSSINTSQIFICFKL